MQRSASIAPRRAPKRASPGARRRAGRRSLSDFCRLAPCLHTGIIGIRGFKSEKRAAGRQTYLLLPKEKDHWHDYASALFNGCMEDIVHAWLLRVRDLEVRAAPSLAAADACCAAWLNPSGCAQALLQARRSELEAQDASVRQLRSELERSRRQQARLGVALAA